ncbi:MAG: phage tail protein [bacterium]
MFCRALLTIGLLLSITITSAEAAPRADEKPPLDLTEIAEAVVQLHEWMGNDLPAKWEGPELDATGNDVAMESLELVHEGLAALETEPAKRTPAQKALLKNPAGAFKGKDLRGDLDDLIASVELLNVRCDQSGGPEALEDELDSIIYLLQRCKDRPLRFVWGDPHISDR